MNKRISFLPFANVMLKSIQQLSDYYSGFRIKTRLAAMRFGMTKSGYFFGKNKRLSISFLVLMISVLISCGTSTGTRYSKTNDQKKNENTTSEVKEESNSTLKEDFDITPYKTEIVVPEKKNYTGKNDKNIWFDYGTPQTETKPKSLIGTEDGFRVLVLTTDNIEEANQIKADVYFSKNADDVYVDFEPPFYKVKVGDFELQKSADDLRFKLNQLGYKEAKVIKDKINIFK